MDTATTAQILLTMATWFNLRLITTEIPDRHYRGGPLALFSAELFTAEGRPLTMRHRAVSLARALAPIADLGIFRAPEPRLILHVYDPLAGDRFMALGGPLETDAHWAVAAIERVRGSGPSRMNFWRRISASTNAVT